MLALRKRHHTDWRKWGFRKGLRGADSGGAGNLTFPSCFSLLEYALTLGWT